MFFSDLEDIFSTNCDKVFQHLTIVQAGAQKIVKVNCAAIGKISYNVAFATFYDTYGITNVISIALLSAQMGEMNSY